VAFAAQQAAEKAVKAVALSHGWSPAGHRIEDLLVQAAGERPSGVVLNCAGRLTAHFGRARYPTGVEGPMPGDLYHQDEAEQAIADAAAVLAYCEGLAARS